MKAFSVITPIHPRNPKIVRLASRITWGEISEERKAKAILEWMQRNITYGHLKLFRHPYARTDLEVLEDGEGLCQDLTALYISLAMAAGLETRLATYSHIGASIRTENDEWILVDPTPFYYPNFRVGEVFRREPVSVFCREFQRWTQFVLDDAQYVGLTLGGLLIGGPCYERIIDMRDGLLRLVFSSMALEHGERGGLDCDASRMAQRYILYQLSIEKPNYKDAYKTYPLEVRREFELKDRGFEEKSSFLEYRGRHVTIYEGKGISTLPSSIKRKYAVILRHIPKVEPLTKRVLSEMKKIHALRERKRKPFSRDEIMRSLMTNRMK